VAAAALMDLKRSQVVGERSYGDAGIRKTVLMDDGAAVILSMKDGALLGERRAPSRELRQLVAWLLDAKRSGFVTGANFVVDGGMTRKMIYEK